MNLKSRMRKLPIKLKCVLHAKDESCYLSIQTIMSPQLAASQWPRKRAKSPPDRNGRL